MILNETLDTLVAEIKVSAKQIQVIKYSPDGKTLAIGCHDQKIYFFDGHSFKKRAECKGHSSYVTHLDFAKDSKVLQSNSGAYELLYCKFFCTAFGSRRKETRLISFGFFFLNI